MSESTNQQIHAQYPGDVAKPKKKRRIFLWVFLAIQALFLVWLIGAGATDSTCVETDVNFEACQVGEGVGRGIAFFLIIGLWLAADVILGIGYLIYKVSRR